MKKLLLLTLTLFCAYSVKAQIDPVRTELDHIFQYVNKSLINTGYLNEYGPVVVEKKWINGVLADSNFIYDIDVWNLIYNDIENSKINPAAPSMKPLDSAQIYNELARYDTASMLTFFTANYDVMREDAVLLNLFTVSNNQLFDVPGRTQNPYMTKHIFAAAPVLPESPFDNEIRIAYKSLFFGNTAKTISKVQVDFLDGSGYQNIFSGGLAMQVSKFYYDSTSYKRFAIKVTYTDATTDECYSRQLVRVNTAGAILYRFAPLSPQELATPVHRIQPTAYINASPYVPPIFLVTALQNIQKFNQDMKIYIRYSSLRNGTSLQGKIVKPLIVVEGYDITDASRLLKPDNYGINDLIKEWESFEIKSVFDINKKLDEEAGYDLIFLDYYTMRSITENADYLLQAIDWINSQKKNNVSGIREQNVVMGISMGGLVTRYALAKRSKQTDTNSTETKMLITMDSPHQGANVPLGLQHFLYDLGEAKIIMPLKDKSDQLRAFYKLNNEVATQQQLIWRVTDGNGNRVANTFLAAGGPYRTMVDYNEPYQFLAVSNGSQCGQQIMAPGSLIMERSGHVAFAAWLGVALNNYRLAVQVNALPAYGTQSQICYVKMERNIRLLLGIIGTGWKTTSTTSPRISPPNTLPWDGVPGGTQDVERGGPIADKGLSVYVVVNVKYNINFNFAQHEFSFVPLTSSLDVQNVNSGTFNQQFLFPVNGNLNGSRSDKYLAQENTGGKYNNPHTDFTARNSQWIFKEMENKSQTYDCDDYCDLNTIPIIGNTALCSCETYTINNLPAGTIVTWSASPLGRVSLTPDGQSVTVCRILDGTITLTATISGPCGNSTSTKTINVGLPYITQNAGSGSYTPYPHDLEPGEEPPVNQICTGQQISLNVNVERASGVSWSRTFANPTNTTWSQSGNSLSFYLWGNNQQANFLASAFNSCGVAQVSFSFKSIACGGDPGDPDPCNQFVVSPNPAVSNINIYVPNIPPPCDDPPIIISKSEKNGSLRGITQVKLFDNLGNLKKQQSTAKTKQLSLNISGLTPGIYYLEISDGTFKERQKVVIQ